MIIEKQKIVDALKATMPGVEKGLPSVTGADAFVFKDGKVFTYNSNVSVSVPLDIGGLNFGVKAQNFYNLIAKMPEMQIDIELDGNKVKVKSGKTKASLALVKTDDMEEMFNAIAFGEMKDVPKGFSAACKLVEIEGNTTPMKGIIAVPKDGKTIVLSTDKIRIFTYQLEGEMEMFFVDDQILDQALAIGEPTKYCVKDSWLHFGFESGAVFSCVRRDHSAYEYNAAIAALDRFTSMDGEISGAFPENVGAALTRCSVMSSKLVIGGSNDDVVRLTFTKEGLSLFAERDGEGEVEEVVGWDADVTCNDGVNVSSRVSVKFLNEITSRSGTFKVVEVNPVNHAKGICLLADNFKAIITCCVK